MNFKELIQKIELKHFKNIVLALVIFLVILLVFSAGVFVGIEKTKFSYGWSKNYYNNFVDRPFGPPPVGDPKHFKAHGLTGQIIKINDKSLVIKNINNTETAISVPEMTIIRDENNALKFTDLKDGENIVIIGSPNSDGQIESKFIRIIK